ncbi:MAG: hypothetical protein DCC68_12065 [Planctomycetota bacterium]|nr:MAG: hypothetical protein DCC68_12065 [Planctomycetota bacterium]
MPSRSIQLLRAAGVRTVAVSRSMESLELAVEAGAEAGVCAGETDAAERIREFAARERNGVHCAFEMVGLARTMELAANAVMRGGRIVVVGEEVEFPAIDTIRIAQRELQILGSRNGGVQDAVDALGMIARGIIRPPIAARFPLAQINEALAVVRTGCVHGRVIVDVGGAGTERS